MKQALFVFFGGGLGAVSRFGLSRFISHRSVAEFPFGTLAVNLIGCFIIGFLFEMFDRVIIPSEWRALALTGFVGAFTTFSTFSLETVNLLRDGEWKFGLINIIGNNLLGIGLVIIGIFTAGFIFQSAR